MNAKKPALRSSRESSGERCTGKSGRLRGFREAQARRAGIPLLSVQPLVENAVKHGVAPRTGAGFVRLDVTTAGRANRYCLELRGV